jgi:hypothetical protein
MRFTRAQINLRVAFATISATIARSSRIDRAR